MSTPFHVRRHLLRPGSREAVRQWQQKMQGLQDQAREALRHEGIDLELWVFELGKSETEPDSLLVVMRTDDYERAVEVYGKSTLAVDAMHREFLARVSLGGHSLEVLECLEPLAEDGAASDAG